MRTISHDNDNGIGEAELQAYVDGQLESHRRVAVEAYLATSPVERERLAAYRRINIGLHALFDRPAAGDLESPTPAMARLAAELDRKLNGQSRTQPLRRVRRAAAAILFLCAAGLAGWSAMNGSERDDTPGALVPAVLDSGPPAAAPNAVPELAPQTEKDRPLPAPAGKHSLQPKET